MAVQAMGIMNVSGSKEVAIALQGNSSLSHDPAAIKEVMRWDMWSPWATFYEFHSTHPLTAKRINAIGTYARDLRQEPFVFFDAKKPESYWDDFFQDLMTLFLPWLLGIGFTLVYAILFLSGDFSRLILPFTLGMALGGVIKTTRQYPGAGFLNHSVLSLLKKIKVSPVRSFAVRLKGHIIGRGEAGNIFSEDLVLRDRTGIIFLDHEPFGFNFFFALFRINKFKGKDVDIEGWYRRAPIPYVEVRKISTNETSSSSYTYYYKIGAWIILGTGGIILSLFL